MPEKNEFTRKCRWLASYPKSGNTWVRLFLNAYITGYCDINKMLITTTDNSVGFTQGALSVPLSEVPETAVLHARGAALFNAIACTKAGVPIIFKTHNAQKIVRGIPLIPEEYTHSAIYLVRDPRSVVISLSKHNAAPIEQVICDMTIGGHLQAPMPPGQQSMLRHYVDNWSAHVESWTTDSVVNTMLIRYESMLEDPVTTFRKILEHYGIVVDEDRLEKAVAAVSLDKIKAQEEEKGFVENPGFQRNDGTKFFGTSKKWEDVLTEKQIRKIELDHGDVMDKLGYKRMY